MKKRKLLLVLSTGLAAVGVIISFIPVPIKVGFGCGDLGCMAYETIITPRVVLGALVFACGLISLAFGLSMDEEPD